MLDVHYIFQVLVVKYKKQKNIKNLAKYSIFAVSISILCYIAIESINKVLQKPTGTAQSIEDNSGENSLSLSFCISGYNTRKLNGWQKQIRIKNIP